MKMILRPLLSSLGTKYLMALTGLALILFILGHMAGNLLIYAGQETLNGYAQKLKENPALLWGARSGLLVVFLLHLLLALHLSAKNRLSRPRGYIYEDTVQATWASRNMLLTGLVLLAFLLYHLAHFTLGYVKEANVVDLANLKQEKLNYLKLEEVYDAKADKYVPRYSTDAPREPRILPDSPKHRHDVYTMVVSGFRNPFVSVSYLLAMVFLWLHLWHGGSSWLQSLGWNRGRSGAATRWLGPVIATLVLVGNCSIPISVWCGLVK